MNSGSRVNVNDNIGTDRSAGPSTGAVRLTAGNNIVVRQDVVTRDAPLIASAVNGTVTVVRGAQLREGNSVLKEGDADNPVRTARILCAFCAQINVTPSPSPVLHRDAPPPALPALTEIFIDAPNGVDVARFTPPPFNGDTPPPNAIAPIGLREIQPPGFAPPVSFPSRTSDPTPPVLASTPATNGTTHSAGSLPANQTGEFAALFFADKDTVTTNVNEQRVFGAALNSEPPAISPFGAAKTPVIMFGGGRGVARTADLGRGGSVGAVPNVFTEEGPNE